MGWRGLVQMRQDRGFVGFGNLALGGLEFQPVAVRRDVSAGDHHGTVALPECGQRQRRGGQGAIDNHGLAGAYRRIDHRICDIRRGGAQIPAHMHSPTGGARRQKHDVIAGAQFRTFVAFCDPAIFTGGRQDCIYGGAKIFERRVIDHLAKRPDLDVIIGPLLEAWRAGRAQVTRHAHRIRHTAAAL